MTAEELLATMTEPLAEDNVYCTIDPETKVITIPPEYQLLGVENDKRVERIPFRCPKIVGDNQDLSQGYQLFLNYQNANGDPDAYHIGDMEIDGDDITFSWLLEENVTKYKGSIQIAFGAIKPGDESEDPDKNRWNTTINTDCICLVGLKSTQQVAESNPDALAQIWAAIDELKAGGGGGTPGKPGGGITKKQITALDELFKIVAYTTNPESQYKSFCEAFGIEPVIPPEGKYTVTNNLTNVSNNNSALSVNDGEEYNAVLIPDAGYEIDSVIIEMGLIDVTNEVYSDGSININSVTGNIVITAIAVQSSASGQLPQEGLVDYFDFRNKPYNAGTGGLYYINSDSGNGMVYSWSNQSNIQGDEFGIKGLGGMYSMYRATGYPVTDGFPSPRTLCFFGNGGIFTSGDVGLDGTIDNRFLYRPKYKATDQSTKQLSNVQEQYPEGFAETGYNACFIVVNQNLLKVYFDDTLCKTFDGNEIDNFESWDLQSININSSKTYGTAFAVYDKELSKIEIVEALEFFKTLEVSE